MDLPDLICLVNRAGRDAKLSSIDGEPFMTLLLFEAARSVRCSKQHCQADGLLLHRQSVVRRLAGLESAMARQSCNRVPFAQVSLFAVNAVVSEL